MPTQLFPHPKDLMAGPAKSDGGPVWTWLAGERSGTVSRRLAWGSPVEDRSSAGRQMTVRT